MSEPVKKRQKQCNDTEGTSEPKPNDILLLDVGGTHMTTYRRTLTQFEGSLLASQFSGRWENGLAKTEEGRYFIDQPARVFGPLLDYLRSKACATDKSGTTPLPVLSTENDYRDFIRMVEYFGLTAALYPAAAHRLVGRHMDFLAMIPSDEIIGKTTTTTKPNKSTAMTETLILHPPHDRIGASMHGRTIYSFEITVHHLHTVLQVGWLGRDVRHGGKWYMPVEDDSGDDDSATIEDEANEYGVGYKSTSTALDVVKGVIATSETEINSDWNPTMPTPPLKFKITRNELPKLHAKKGSVIRCERGQHGFSWFVDETLVASSNEASTRDDDDDDDDGPNRNCLEATQVLADPFAVPCVSANGSFTVSNIEYTY